MKELNTHSNVPSIF